MIDLHSHILPGLDDGARDLDDALDIARAAAADGISVIAATPHVREDYPTTADAMENGVRQLRAEIEREGIDLELLPGGEVSIEQIDRLSNDELRRFGLGGNPKYLLVETPYSAWPLCFGEIVHRLGVAGMTAVIAHPERNGAVQADNEKVAELARAGALIQVTAASLDGRLGSRARNCARDLIAAELADMVGSDAHMAGVREVGLSGACKAIGDPQLARWLTELVPGAIVRGGDFPTRPTPKGRRGFFACLRGR
ncbi:MAG: capsular biosynthesis protein [Actinobacteria bacterium]|nr:capsular biosynthesis protein [Actinomycetota bacterium]